MLARVVLFGSPRTRVKSCLPLLLALHRNRCAALRVCGRRNAGPIHPCAGCSGVLIIAPASGLIATGFIPVLVTGLRSFGGTMASRKKTGTARSGALRSRSRPAGPTITLADTGMTAGAPHSITRPPSPFSLAAQQQEALRTSPKPSKKKRKMGSRGDSRSLKQGDFMVYGPFWSDAMRAYRVEYWERDSMVLGGEWGSSFYCSREEDAVRIAAVAKLVKSRTEWLELRELATEMAVQQKEGFLYRVMLGSREHYPLARTVGTP